MNLSALLTRLLEHLRQAHGIAGDLVRHLGCDRGREVEPLRLRALAEQRHDGVDDLGRVDGDALELELARLDLGEVQDVVDDREQALARAGDDLGIAALPHRQIRRCQELGHDQHAVHRRADLVAHGGEELGLRDVGGLRRLLGLAQIVGAIGDLLLERLAVLLEAMVALADLADHAVEARRQDADLVVALDLDGGAVVVALADGRHGAGERDERRRDRALQPERDHEADRHRERGAGDRGEQQVAEAAEQVVRVADDDEAADGLAGIDDRDRDLDGPARQQAPERDLLAGIEVEVAFEAHRRAEVGDRRAGAVLDHREHHARHLADGAHRLQDGVHVAVGERARACGAEHLRCGKQRLALRGGVAAGLVPDAEPGNERKPDPDRDQYKPAELEVDRAPVAEGVVHGSPRPARVGLWRLLIRIRLTSLVYRSLRRCVLLWRLDGVSTHMLLAHTREGDRYVFDQPLRLLAVDDDPIMREFAVAQLSQPGCEIVTAEDGEAAWDILQRRCPRLRPRPDRPRDAAAERLRPSRPDPRRRRDSLICRWS